ERDKSDSECLTSPALVSAYSASPRVSRQLRKTEACEWLSTNKYQRGSHKGSISYTVAATLVYLHGRHQFMGRSYRSCRFKAQTVSNPVAISFQPSRFRNGYLRIA